MKIIRLLATTSLFSLSAAASALASTSLVKPVDLTMPAPIKIVHPTDVPSEYRGVTVKVQFTLDRNGIVHDLKPVGYMPQALASHLLPAVSHWEFSPRYNAKGQAIETKVTMPVQLVDGGV